MSKENYKNFFNGGCSTCMFAERDERGRYIGHCSGFSNCSYEQYKGETDITEEEKDAKIADLEAKLAESEKYKAWVLEFLEKCKIDTNSTPEYSQNPIIEYLEQVSDFRAVDCEELKQQLAEKEEELKEFKSIGATPRQLQRAYQDRYKYNERCSELKKQHTQNKINFAVSYLEVIKAFIIDKEFYFTGEDYSTVYVEDITEEIDNQIKAIKEKK